MTSSHRKPTRTRTRVIALTAVTLGLAGAGVAGVASAGTFHRGRAAAHHAPQPSASASGFSALAGRDRGGWHHGRPSAPASTAPSSAAPSSAAPSSAAPSTAAPSTAAPSSAAPAPSASSSAPATDSGIVEQALAHINAARAAENLAPLTLDAKLSAASEAHNALMAGTCGMSHQCAGEAALGDRFTAAGVTWRSAGENIGQGWADDNDTAILAAANGLTDQMLAEVAPDDGHRRNLLSTGFTDIGLAVLRADDGKVWLTQDFVQTPAS